MVEYSEELLRLNDEACETLIPAIVIICMLMVIGICGNPLVVYFYACLSKPTSTYMFIVTLAVFDLVICSVSMPLELVDIIRFYTFASPEACKLLRFVNYFASISSSGILIAIAVDRYRKICKPFESQITIKIARIVITAVCVISVVISWPSLVFYTVVEVNVTEIEGVSGFDCTTRRDSDYKVYITIYNIFLFLFFITAITTLLVLYILVGKRLCTLTDFRFPARKYSQRLKRTPQNALKPETEVFPNRPNSARPCKASIHASNNLGKGASKFSSPTGVRGEDLIDSSMADVKTRDKDDTVMGKGKVEPRNISTRKYTVVLLCVTIAFIISFLPYLGLITWRTLSKDYEPNMLAKSELVAFQIFIRSFLFNSAANPLIYGFLNTEFQNFILSLFRKICYFCCSPKDNEVRKKSMPGNSAVSKSTSSQ